ncbi:metallophosphoesterase [Halosimplex rubrum]|uniref:Metallophosphoesterase n=1 Tax=Halosimplex rubrum TaxID=869889 RepID=A0A7D5P6Z5_9EURY|nr:metallophosphoesterase [Halosimplex rubrum]QLH76120.1 metallophosphoesterase [Halosimplex rubrum]
MTGADRAEATGGAGGADGKAAPGPVFARLDRPRSDPAVTLAVIADPHVAVAERGTWKVYHRTLARLRTAVAVANARADAALIAGDLTRDGHPAEFDAVDDALADLSVPWRAIPGNHDVPKAFDDHATPSVERFAERYGPLPFAWEVGDVTLLGLDTAAGDDLRDTWGGRVGSAQRAWLAERLADAERPVVAVHHPVARLPERPEGDRWRNFRLWDADAVAGLLCEHDAPLALSGHQHVPAVVSHGGPAELLAPATCSFPQTSVHLEVGPEGTTVRLVPLADPDGVAEAHGLARDGKPLGRVVCELAERRLVGRLGD